MNWCSGFWKTKPTRVESVRASLRPTSIPSIANGPARGRDDSGDRLDERGLARAVRADDGDELSSVHVEVDVVEHLGAAAAHRESADLDEWVD